MIRWLFRWLFRKPFGDRSGQWPTVRKNHLLAWPNCAVCGTAKKLEVHHIIPYQMDPTLELDPTNLLTLCRRDHFLFGHLDNWKRYNPQVVTDAIAWRRRLDQS